MIVTVILTIAIAIILTWTGISLAVLLDSMYSGADNLLVKISAWYLGAIVFCAVGAGIIGASYGIAKEITKVDDRNEINCVDVHVKN